MTTPADTTSITRPVVLHLALDGCEIPVRTDLGYRPADPYAVTLTMYSGAVVIRRWVIARDILRDGCLLPAGDGDIHITPTRDGRVRLEMRTPDGEATFHAVTAAVVDFLDAAYALVCDGDETSWIDQVLDGELAELLGAGQ